MAVEVITVSDVLTELFRIGF